LITVVGRHQEGGEETDPGRGCSSCQGANQPAPQPSHSATIGLPASPAARVRLHPLQQHTCPASRPRSRFLQQRAAPRWMSRAHLVRYAIENTRKRVGAAEGGEGAIDSVGGSGQARAASTSQRTYTGDQRIMPAWDQSGSRLNHCTDLRTAQVGPVETEPSTGNRTPRRERHPAKSPRRAAPHPDPQAKARWLRSRPRNGGGGWWRWKGRLQPSRSASAAVARRSSSVSEQTAHHNQAST